MTQKTKTEIDLFLKTVETITKHLPGFELKQGNDDAKIIEKYNCWISFSSTVGHPLLTSHVGEENSLSNNFLNQMQLYASKSISEKIHLLNEEGSFLSWKVFFVEDKKEKSINISIVRLDKYIVSLIGEHEVLNKALLVIVAARCARLKINEEFAKIESVSHRTQISDIFNFLNTNPTEDKEMKFCMETLKVPHKNHYRRHKDSKFVNVPLL